MHPNLIRHYTYTYTRIIQDKHQLHENQIQLITYLLKNHVSYTNKFDHILPLGRDYIRILKSIENQIENLYKDLVSNPTSFSPNFINIEQFWGILTPTEFLVSRLTPDMEFKLVFILQKVPAKLHQIYLERFCKRFLTPNSTLMCDLVRFICAVVHPNNTVLRSGVVQRWDLVRSLFFYVKVFLF
jgi:integrator complex subunit 3